MHEPNEVFFSLDVMSAVSMNIAFKHPRNVVTVPPERSERRRNGKTWYHIINHSNQKYATETGALDDFIAKPTELTSLFNKASQGNAPLYVARKKASVESMCSSAVSSRKEITRHNNNRQHHRSKTPHPRYRWYHHTRLYTGGHSKTQNTRWHIRSSPT